MNNIQLNPAAPEGFSTTILSDGLGEHPGMASIMPETNAEQPAVPKRIQVGRAVNEHGDPLFVRLVIGDTEPVLLPPKQARHLAECLRQESHAVEGRGQADTGGQVNVGRAKVVGKLAKRIKKRRRQ